MRSDGGAQLRRQHVGGVDDVVRARAQLLEKLALALDALADGAPVLAERMAPATGLVARDELLVGGVEEDDAMVDAPAVEGVELRGEPGEEVAVARVAHHGEAAFSVGLPRHAGELEQVADEARRQVVHAEVAQILERVHGLRTARATHAADDDELGHMFEGGVLALSNRPLLCRFAHGAILPSRIARPRRSPRSLASTRGRRPRRPHRGHRLPRRARPCAPYYTAAARGRAPRPPPRARRGPP